MKRARKILFVVITLALAVILGACENTLKTFPLEEESALTGEESVIKFTFEATDDMGELTTFEIETAQTTVGAALLENGLIDGTPSQYGLKVEVVNGLRADYDTDRAYWAFYVDGEYATTGVDSTIIERGKTYALIYTKG